MRSILDSEVGHVLNNQKGLDIEDILDILLFHAIAIQSAILLTTSNSSRDFQKEVPGI